MTTERPAHDDAQPELPQLPRPKHLPLIRTDAPLIIPARMLNEFIYCERLMYLEWVHGEFADNYFTVDGRFVHERADTPGGKLPEPSSAAHNTEETEARTDGGPQVELAPAEMLEFYKARSVWLTSESLGITAKVDVVEGGADGSVIPIEYKRGAVPNVPEGAYRPERVQLCAQAPTTRARISLRSWRGLLREKPATRRDRDHGRPHSSYALGGTGC